MTRTLITILFLLSLFSAYSQNEEAAAAPEKFRFGLTLGANFLLMGGGYGYVDYGTVATRPGLLLGAGVEKKISRLFRARLEAYFRQNRGALAAFDYTLQVRLEDGVLADYLDRQGDVRLHYIQLSVPLMLDITPFKNLPLDFSLGLGINPVIYQDSEVESTLTVYYRPRLPEGPGMPNTYEVLLPPSRYSGRDNIRLHFGNNIQVNFLVGVGYSLTIPGLGRTRLSARYRRLAEQGNTELFYGKSERGSVEVSLGLYDIFRPEQ